jgi:pyruvate formate lyase activating enzyme
MSPSYNQFPCRTSDSRLSAKSLITGLVFDIRKYSIHDGPGIRTAVFLKGCPLRCIWCHNPEGLSPSPEILNRRERCVEGDGSKCGRCLRACPLAALEGRPGLDPRRDAGTPACSACPSFGSCAEACPAEALQLVGRRMSVEEVMAEVVKDRPFYEDSGGGATFTGGEPLAQPEFILGLLRACKAEGIRSALDTSGWAARELILEAGALADLVLFDLKLIDDRRHEASTGVPSAPILGNLVALSAAGARIALRVPLIPGINDSPLDLEDAARFAASLGGRMNVHILPYHDAGRGKYGLRDEAYPMGEARSPGAEAARAAALVFERSGLDARIGG